MSRVSQFRCRKCNGALRRVHRNLIEKFLYYGVFECLDCRERFFSPRRHQYFFGPAPRCPQCGTRRITKLKRPDHIDPMYYHPMTLLQRLIPGSRLFHCRYCRIQFFDRRALRKESPAESGDAVGQSS
jgi:hypothetical protein